MLVACALGWGSRGGHSGTSIQVIELPLLPARQQCALEMLLQPYAPVVLFGVGVLSGHLQMPVLQRGVLCGVGGHQLGSHVRDSERMNDRNQLQPPLCKLFSPTLLFFLGVLVCSA